jgi:hypothetical protein
VSAFSCNALIVLFGQICLHNSNIGLGSRKAVFQAAADLWQRTINILSFSFDEGLGNIVLGSVSYEPLPNHNRDGSKKSLRFISEGTKLFVLQPAKSAASPCPTLKLTFPRGHKATIGGVIQDDLVAFRALVLAVCQDTDGTEPNVRDNYTPFENVVVDADVVSSITKRWQAARAMVDRDGLAWDKCEGMSFI